MSISKKLAIFLLVSLIPACYAQEGFKVSTWQGDYEYSDSFSDGNQSVITDIKLKVGPDGSCSILWEGFQKDESIVCKVNKSALKGSGIDVDFVSYSDGKVENEYGVAVYGSKERLFSLIENGGKGLETVWSEKYQPPKAKRSGVFFKKLD